MRFQNSSLCLSNLDPKSSRDVMLEQQLHAVQAQRIEDFKMFEQKLTFKSRLLSQANLELSASVHEVSIICILFATLS